MMYTTYMSLNCNEINIILEELNLEGSFIQDIIQPNFDSIGLYTYKEGAPHTIYVCTAPLSCRINETKRKISKNEKPLRFMEFLKSRIKGARINSICQIDLERIIKIELSHTNKKFIMYIRLWSNAGNILLCDTVNTILDSMYRRPARGEVTGGIFKLPAKKEKKKTKEWPVRDFSEIQKEYSQKFPEKNFLSFNEKVDLWYSEYAQRLSIESLLQQAEKWYVSRRTRQENALEKLKLKYKSFQNAEQCKHTGDLILTYGNNIQKGSKYLDCIDYNTNNTVHILIDSEKTPQQNAADYYTKYKKENSGKQQLYHDIAIAQKSLEALDAEYERICRQKNPIRIEQMLRKNEKPKQQIKKTHPGLDYTIDGWYILVGRDANENDDLLRHYVKGQDLWMHTRDCPGGFVFIKNKKNKTIPLNILLYAGNLAVYYSKARKAGKADLYYTRVNHLRRAKNGPKGLVLPTLEKNLHIKLDEKMIQKLDEIKKDIL